jgi:SPP1 gp7 family putative phage head morphogenesis protein
MKSGEGVADRRLRDVNRRLNEVYAQAVKELEKTLKDFEQKHEARDADMRQKLADGKITKAEYDSWKRGQVFQGKQWKAKLDAATQTLVHADEEAVRITNRERGKTFQAAANAELQNASKQTGIDFNLYDRGTVDRILREQPNLLPPRRVKKATDSAWYHQQISNAVTRSIIEGDPIDSLARKIARATGESSRKAARRNARTAMTAAQNAGRMESMREVQESGIQVKKKWLATLDKRTRDTHADLDGEETGVDEPFKTPLGEIMYPGDPHANPALVYNCRCTLLYVYPEYAAGKAKRRDQVTHGLVDDMTYREWERGGAKGRKPSFAEQLVGIELSPYRADYPNYRDYDQDAANFAGKRTEYFEDVYPDAEMRWSNPRRLYDGVEYANASAIDNTMARLQEKYPAPKVHGRMTICDIEDAYQYLPKGKGDRRWREDELPTAQVFGCEGNTVIGFDRSTMTGTLREAIEARDKAIQNGEALAFVSPIDTPETIVMHEWGHVLDRYRTIALVYKDQNATDFLEWYKSLDKQEIKEGVSSYAAEKLGEFCAECFLEMQMPNPRPIAQKYWEFMEPIIRRGVESGW